jgi:hypothetical protein
MPSGLVLGGRQEGCALLLCGGAREHVVSCTYTRHYGKRRSGILLKAARREAGAVKLSRNGKKWTAQAWKQLPIVDSSRFADETRGELLVEGPTWPTL